MKNVKATDLIIFSCNYCSEGTLMLYITESLKKKNISAE